MPFHTYKPSSAFATCAPFSCFIRFPPRDLSHCLFSFFLFCLPVSLYASTFLCHTHTKYTMTTASLCSCSPLFCREKNSRYVLMDERFCFLCKSTYLHSIHSSFIFFFPFSPIRKQPNNQKQVPIKINYSILTYPSICTTTPVVFIQKPCITLRLSPILSFRFLPCRVFQALGYVYGWFSG